MRITEVLKLLEPLSLNLNYWKAQNIYFSLKEQLRAELSEKGNKGDESTKEWFCAFSDLSEALRIKVS